jgi:small subunit ribosomal protein S15
VLDKETKQGIMGSYRQHDKDSGSTEIQVAVLTERVKELTNHMAGHRHDFGAQRGLLKLVGHRRRLLSYLSREDIGRYNKLISRLGLRK